MIRQLLTATFLHMRTSASRLRHYLLALAILPVFGQRARGQMPSDSAVQAIIQARVTTRQAVGIVVAVVDRGRTKLFTAGSSGATGVTLDGNTVFEIGSITKVFTSALLADMVARGEVSLDDPISRYLPASVRVPTRDGREIKLVDLATQFSGLPRLPRNLSPRDARNPYADYTVEQLYAFLSGYELTRGIGDRYEYSNLGVGLLGHVLALRAGKSYEQLVKERILEPLRMRDTRIVLTPALKERLAVGHDEAGSMTWSWDLPTLAGAGALRSTANDMVKFLVANLDSPTSPLALALASTRVARRDVPGGPLEIGLGWHILTPFGRPIVWHNGGTGGYRAFIGLDHGARRGVVVLSNQAISPDDIGMHLLETRIPLTPPPKQRQEIAVDSAVLATYVGVYEISPAFALTVTREGSSLFAQATGQERLRLFAESPTEFFYRIVDAQVTFEKDARGRVVRLILHQGGQHIPGARK